MKAQPSINLETLIPSSLLEEENSDKESISNMKLINNIPIFKDVSKKNVPDDVIHFLSKFITFYI